MMTKLLTILALLLVLSFSIPHTLKLKFVLAARAGAPLITSRCTVYWNDKEIGRISPRDYIPRYQSANVQTRSGLNKVGFSGAGPSDGAGATISLVGAWNEQKNYIVNGDFSQPDVGNGWKIFTNGIPGWKGNSIEIGRGSIYNPKWASPTRRVCELDVKENVSITQEFSL